MPKHDLRSFSLNLLYLIFGILTWTGLSVLLSHVPPINRGDLGTILL